MFMDSSSELVFITNSQVRDNYTHTAHNTLVAKTSSNCKINISPLSFSVCNLEHSSQMCVNTYVTRVNTNAIPRQFIYQLMRVKCSYLQSWFPRVRTMGAASIQRHCSLNEKRVFIIHKIIIANVTAMLRYTSLRGSSLSYSCLHKICVCVF